MTEGEQLNKILEYRSDLKTFIKENIYLELPGGAVKFNPYGKQLNVIDEFVADNNLLFIKSRQIGISTIVQAIITACIVLYSNVTVGVISKDGPEATDFVKKIKDMLGNLPAWIKPKFKKKLEQDIQLQNGSRVVASCVNAQKPSACLRGKSITILVIDEAAFISHIDTAYTSMMPAVSKNQQIAKQNGIPYGTFIISTPNRTVGMGAWYFDMYRKSKAEANSYKLVQIYWREIEGLDDIWYEEQCNLLNNDQDKIDQELEMKFISTDDAIFSREIQEWFQEEKNFSAYIKQKVELELSRGEDLLIPRLEVNIKIFEQYDPLKKYLICVDTAPESGACKSAILVLDRFTLQICASYTDILRVQFLTELIKKVSDMYKTSFLIIESNSYGNQVLEELSIIPRYNRKLFYYRESPNMKRKLYEPPPSAIQTTKKPGLPTSVKTRPLIIDSMLSHVRDNYKLINCQDVALQLLGLVRGSNNKIKHGTRSLDDLVMALGLGCFVYYFNLVTDANLSLEEKEFMSKMFAGGEVEFAGNQPGSEDEDTDENSDINIDDFDKLFG